jgi:DNA recombination-dependent growth factor C
MWFKSAMLYGITDSQILASAPSRFGTPAFESTVGAFLSELLENKRFQAPTALQEESCGWVAPDDGSELLVQTVGNFLLLKLKTERKVISRPQLNQVLAEKLAIFKVDTGRAPSKNERFKLKEKAQADLFAAAWGKQDTIALSINFKKKQLIVDTAAFKSADSTISFLLASFNYGIALCPAWALPDFSKSSNLTDWLLSENNRPLDFSLNSPIALKMSADETVGSRHSNFDIDDPIILDQINAGMMVKRVGFAFRNDISGVIDTHLVLSQIKRPDVLIDLSETVDFELGDTMRCLNTLSELYDQIQQYNFQAPSQTHPDQSVDLRSASSHKTA